MPLAVRAVAVGGLLALVVQLCRPTPLAAVMRDSMQLAMAALPMQPPSHRDGEVSGLSLRSAP